MTGPQRSQQGIILIGLMLVLVIAAGATFLQQANRSNATALEREAKTTATLLAARDALLARAILDANRPGSLRCPALDDVGISPLATPCPSYAGRFPWRTVDTTDFRDSSGTTLWYVLAPAFQDGSTPINSSSSATLSLNGQPDIVALIIAPGGALPGQNRPSNNMADYLDDLNGNPATSNRDGDEHFFSGTDSDSFNDRIIAISKTAWQDAVAKRVLGEIRYAVAFVGGPLPEADTNGDGKPDASADIGAFPYKFGDYDSTASTTWQGEAWHKSLEQNGWFPLVTYNRLNRTLSLNGHTVTLP